jgi:type IV secretory pathway TrbL component
MLEWPIVALASSALDETSGGGEEGARAWYLYPVSQLPRIASLVVILLLVLLAVPFVPTMLWLLTLGWVFILAAGLWGALYDWRGGLLLAGGLIPVMVHLLVLIGYLVSRR